MDGEARTCGFLRVPLREVDWRRLMVWRPLPEAAQAAQLHAQHADDCVGERDGHVAGRVVGAETHAAAPATMTRHQGYHPYFGDC